MKRPAFQFYPDKWMTDQELRSCSIAARGMWADMLCMAHLSEPYGHLTVNGKRKTDAQIINAISGATRALLTELETAGVFSRTDDGTIYSRRMVRDEAMRKVRGEGGELGAEHGPKGGSHGAKGGRQSKEKEGKKPPLHADEKPPLEGSEKPPLEGSEEPPLEDRLKPPPVFASASAFCKPSVVETPTVEAPKAHNAVDKNKKMKQINTERWDQSDQGIEAKGRELGEMARPGETHFEYKQRLWGIINTNSRHSKAAP